jgi:predicted ATP-grasp superfamily ATP-dependent carboligase
MMKVICINNKPINDTDGIPACCNDLVEGKIYSAEYVAKSSWGNDCYFITEIQSLRRVERFRRLDDNWVEELLERLKSEVEAEECVFTQNGL